MEGLEWLIIELILFDPVEGSIWSENEWRFWPEIKRITSPSHFELILPFPAAASTQEETLLCTITRNLVDFDALMLR